MLSTDRIGRTIATVMLTAVPSVAVAQAPPPSVQQAVPTRDQIVPPSVTTSPAPSRVRVDSDNAIASAPCPLETSDVAVSIGSVKFSGPGSAPLAPVLASLLAGIAVPSGSQPVKIVCRIRDEANAALRAAGYVASVQIPPQRIEDGTLTLQVVTAKIVEVRIRGDAGPYQATLAARIAQLKALDPLNERDAERILLLTGDIPGLDVLLALRPAGAGPGEVIGELTVVTSRFSLLGNIQNYGSRQLGRETAYARAAVYGLTGASETYFAGSTTLDFSEQQVVQAGHVQALGNNGATIAGSFIYAWSKPDIGALDLRSRSLIASLEVEAPVLRSLTRNVSLTAGFELIEQRTRTPNPLNRDKLRVLFLRAEGQARQPRADGSDLFRVGARLELRKGLDIFNASTRGGISADGFTPSRFEGDPKATVVKGDVDAVIGVGPIFSLYAAARGQWANRPLLNFEEFSLGNLTIGRGYDPGANSADRAVALRGEVRAKVVENRTARVELYGFYDSVWIYNRDTNAIEDGRRLGSYGGGVRGALPGRAQLDVTYARPTDLALLIPGARRATDRLLLSLTVQFAQGAR